MTLFRDSVVLVTGAGSGIGRAAAVAFAQEDAHVVVTDVDEERARAVADAITAGGGLATATCLDVSDESTVVAVMEMVDAQPGRLRVLHNNAGIHETSLTAQAGCLDLPSALWSRIIDVNLKGTWLCSKYAAPLLARSGGGVIVNSASIGGMVGYPMGSAYGPSKAGLIQLTRTLALELAGQGTRVACYAPGNTDTEMVRSYYGDESLPPSVIKQLIGTHLLDRLIAPEEIAQTVLFLASERASAITGSCLVVDAGTLAWRGVRDWTACESGTGASLSCVHGRSWTPDGRGSVNSESRPRSRRKCPRETARSCRVSEPRTC